MTAMRFTLNLAPGGAARRRQRQAAEAGIAEITEALLTDANMTVPLEEGTLEGSGTASTEGLTGSVSYDTPYAVVQHEDATLRHLGKGRAKWLELTMSERANDYLRRLAERMRRGLG